MKLLKRMLLINWHYINKEMIELNNINFLTGKNGAGKSTILDALQLLLLGNTRGNFFNKAANDKTDRTLEGYLKGEIGDDGDTGYKYLRNDRFSSYIVCEFFDTVTRKNFSLGVVFEVYKDADIENNFFFLNNKIPENEFIGENNIPFTFKDLKSFFTRKYGSKNFEFYSSNKQYQDAMRGKLGGLNQKFFNLFKKAVTFTPIDDIEKFIVEYVCDVKNKIDITSMQENIRQYNYLSKQVGIMKTKQDELGEIERVYNRYVDEVSKIRSSQYLILRAQQQILIDELEELNKITQTKKDKKEKDQTEMERIKQEKEKIDKEIDSLKDTIAKSDINARINEINKQVEELDLKINEIKEEELKNISTFRNNTLMWNSNIRNLDKIKNKIVSDETMQIDKTKDLLAYIGNINEENFKNTEINALEEIKENIENLKKLGNTVFFNTKQEFDNDTKIQKNLENEIQKLRQGIYPYEQELIDFKTQLENKLKQQIGKNIKINILADLLEINDAKWQNAIEGYLNTQKKYLIIEPAYFNQASKIYRELAKENDKIHSFGIVDIGKIQKEKEVVLENSLAKEIKTENELARCYIDYLLGKVIKCEEIYELREHKKAITSDCMLYQGYVLRKINPKFYKYPSIGKKALEQQKQMKEKELIQLTEKMENETQIINTMRNLKDMPNFSDSDIDNFNKNIQKSNMKEEYYDKKQKLKEELGKMDMFWLDNIRNEIKEKEKISDEHQKIYMDINNEIIGLSKDIEINEIEKIPDIKQRLELKKEEIELDYDNNWQKQIGEELYGKENLKNTPQKIEEKFLRIFKSTQKKKDDTKNELVSKRSDYINKYQLSYNILESNNKEFTEELKKLQEIELPQYLEKIEDSRKKAYEQFRIEFLDKLKSNIDEVKSQIKDLNTALGEHRFGTDTYSFKVTPKKEHRRFYNMITDDMLLGDWAIGATQFNEKYSQEIKDLFDKITLTDNNISDEENEKNIKEYTDYRTYLNFDLIVKDKAGNEQRLSKTLLKKSGGETQTPFYISILASFAQLYRTKTNDNTVRLIVFDEAFSKMDSERIEESIKLLRKSGFQAIFAAPPEKLQDIQELVDATLLVLNPTDYAITVRKYTNKEKW